jgi:hypothetical protein
VIVRELHDCVDVHRAAPMRAAQTVLLNLVGELYWKSDDACASFSRTPGANRGKVAGTSPITGA